MQKSGFLITRLIYALSKKAETIQIAMEEIVLVSNYWEKPKKSSVQLYRIYIEDFFWVLFHKILSCGLDIC